MQGPVLRFNATGPFDTQQILALTDAMRAMFDDIPDGLPFAAVIEFKVSMRADEPALAHFERLVVMASTWRRAPVAVGLVAGREVDGREDMMERYQTIFDSKGRKFSSFDNAQACQEWSAQEVARVKRERELAEQKTAERIARESGN